MTIGTRGWSVLAVATAALSLPLGLARSGSQDPDDEAEAKELGRRAFVENCLICHVEAMTTRQRLTTKQWTAEVDKMIGWGAPVPPEQKASLTKYLADSFSDKHPPPPLDTAPPEELLREEASLATPPRAVGDATRGGPLYTQFCANCHGPTGGGAELGPRLAGRPSLMDLDGYREVIHKGRRRMPGFANALKPGDEDDVLAWLRARREELAK